MKNTIEELKKINLELYLANTAQNTQALAPPIPMEFIYGLGTEGLTYFERLLHGKTAGDDIEFSVPKERLRTIFGHLCVDLPGVDDCEADSLAVRASVLRVTPASNREVVKAMASQTSCGDGCDCGCGGH